MQTSRGVKDSLGRPNLQGSGFGIVQGYGNSLWPSKSHQCPWGWWDLVLSLPRASQGAQGAAGVTPPEKTSCRRVWRPEGAAALGLVPRPPLVTPCSVPLSLWQQQPKSHKDPFAGTISFLLCPHTAIKTELLETGRKKHFPLGFELFPDFFPSITLHIFHLPHWKHGNFSPFPLPKTKMSVSTKVFLEQKKWFGKCQKTFSVEILRICAARH